MLFRKKRINKLVVGNFKMNLLYSDIQNYILEVTKYSFENVIYCPSSLYLSLFINHGLKTGAQDVSSYEVGSYTGDISASQLKSLGVKYVIIGHSERRKYYQDEQYINNKLNLCIKEGLVPILCIGENRDEYTNKETLDVLKHQLDESLKEIDVSKIIIAYEPIWSIGTGILPSCEEIYNTIDYIKKYIYNKYEILPQILYGGSVSNQNIKELEKIKNIDGYLVGGCSIKVNDFIEMINYINHN